MPQSVAGRVRGRGLLRLEAGVECFCSWFHPLRSMNDSLDKHCPLPNWRTEGRRKGGELGVKTKMKYFKTTTKTN